MSVLLALPMTAQKMTKEEKAAMQKAAYEAAVAAVNAKAFVIVPDTYTMSDGEMGDNIDNSNFISFEGDKMYAQGSIVCGNKYTNELEITAYEAKFDKKGNLKLKVSVNGRMLKGTLTISMRNKGNNADVIFTPQNSTTIKFSGPIVPLKEAQYNKRSNPV